VQQFNNLVSLPMLETQNQNVPQKTRETGFGGASIRYLPKRNFKGEIYDAFGPDPDWAVKCFVDLGLSDAEISRYVGLPLTCIRMLTRQIRADHHEAYRD